MFEVVPRIDTLYCRESPLDNAVPADLAASRKLLQTTIFEVQIPRTREAQGSLGSVQTTPYLDTFGAAQRVTDSPLPFRCL